MTNTLSTVTASTAITTTEAASHALTWTTKNGQTRRADSATAQAFAPRAPRLDVAQAADLAALKNGQYRPFLASVRAALTRAEQSALVAAPDFSLNPTTKVTVLATLRAIDAEWVRSAAVLTGKGKKPTAMRSALHAVLSAWILDVDTASAAKAAGMPSTGTDAPASIGTDAPASTAPDTNPDNITDVTAKGEELPALL